MGILAYIFRGADIWGTAFLVASGIALVGCTFYLIRWYTLDYIDKRIKREWELYCKVHHHDMSVVDYKLKINDAKLKILSVENLISSEIQTLINEGKKDDYQIDSAFFDNITLKLCKMWNITPKEAKVLLKPFMAAADIE